ncbi:hypothetical protein F5Y17DRAFT_442743 [Xylariaceae sp. FL0594]|nr:hypothetical protein F5Y17DRAFT_442743 [Xylariaceae sp. FL0594]
MRVAAYFLMIACPTQSISFPSEGNVSSSQPNISCGSLPGLRYLDRMIHAAESADFCPYLTYLIKGSKNSLTRN